MTYSSISGCPWLDAVQVQRYDRLYDARPSAMLTLGAALDAIVDGVYAAEISHLRDTYAHHGEDAYAAAKRRLPQITFCGTFSPIRAKANLSQHSGIVLADLDDIQDLDRTKFGLMQDPHVVCCFCSPRGDRLKYCVRIVPVDSDAAYQHAWQTVAEAHQAQYGVTWDPSGKDVCRLCFVSWDPACFINPDAQPFPVPPPPPAPRPPLVMLSRHWPSPRLETAAQRALERAERLIVRAPAGARHAARLKASYLIGGYLATGELSYDEAHARLTAVALANTSNARSARRDIADGIEAGQTRPITNTHPHQPGSDWHSRAITPIKEPLWRKC